MPTVPRKTEQDIAPAGIPDIRTRSVPRGAAFGGGRQRDIQTGLARETLGLVFQITETQRKQREEATAKAKRDIDRMLVLDADLQLAQAQNGIDLKVHQMKGREAAGAMDFINSEWEKNIEAINSTLFNQDQKNAFEISAAKRFLTLSKNTGVHMDTQFNQYQKGLFKSSLKIAQEEAALNYTNAELVVGNFEKQTAIIQQFREMDGESQEWEDNEIAKMRSRTHTEMIRRMIFDNQIELADRYLESIKDEIRNDDLAAIRRLRTEEKRIRLAKSDEFQREVWLRAGQGDITNEQNDDFLQNGQYTVGFHTKIKNFINAPYDRDDIPDTEKTAFLKESFEKFKELRHARIKDGKIVRRAKEKDFEKLQAFRDGISTFEAKGKLTRRQYQNFIAFTQQNWDDLERNKMEIWVAAVRRLDFIFGDSNDNDKSDATATAFGEILGPNANEAQAKEAADRAVENAAIQTNPNKTIYKVGDVITLPSGNWEVKGFDEDGEPLVDPVK